MTPANLSAHHIRFNESLFISPIVKVIQFQPRPQFLMSLAQLSVSLFSILIILPYGVLLWKSEKSPIWVELCADLLSIVFINPPKSLYL